MSEPNAGTQGPTKDPKIIKRYTNRKLYDTVESRYVTLDEIAEMVKQGAEVRIVDNKSKDDLTSVTLAQIIFEEEKKKNRMPLSVLRDIIRHPGEMVSGFIEKEVSPRVASIREEAESRLDRLLRRDGTRPEDRPADGSAELSPPPVEVSAEPKAMQRMFEEWQRKLDESVKQVVENVVGNLPALGRDFQTLNEKLAELEQKVSELEKKNG